MTENGKRLIPNHAPWAPGAVPAEGGVAVHFRSVVVVAGDALLDGELLVALVLGGAADVGHAFRFVLVGVEDFAVHDGVLDFVRGGGGVELLLFGGLWDDDAEARRG